jgi:hypothetical protein
VADSKKVNVILGGAAGGEVVGVHVAEHLDKVILKV